MRPHDQQRFAAFVPVLHRDSYAAFRAAGSTVSAARCDVRFAPQATELPGFNEEAAN